MNNKNEQQNTFWQSMNHCIRDDKEVRLISQGNRLNIWSLFSSLTYCNEIQFIALYIVLCNTSAKYYITDNIRKIDIRTPNSLIFFTLV